MIFLKYCNKIIFLVVIFTLASIVVFTSFQNQLLKVPDDNLNQNKENIINENINIKSIKTYAIVFYGREAQTRILLKYLEKNVKANGGILEKIVFCVKTKNPSDLAYLDKILSQNKSYYESIRFPSEIEYSFIYEKLNDDDLVFKIPSQLKTMKFLMQD